MKALILAAGYATRLYPLTKDMPKPLLKLNGRPILDYIMDEVEKVEGLDKIYIVTNNKFYSHFVHWLVPKLRINADRYKVINDGSTTVESRLGAVGDINLAVDQEKIEDDLLIIAGDNLFNFDLNQFVAFSKEKGREHSVCLYESTNGFDLTRFGIAQLNDNHEIVSFEEKPKSPRTKLISTCIYFIPKEKLYLIPKYLETGKNHDTPGSYISWLSKNERVFGKTCGGMWFDLGDFDTLSEAVAYIHLNKN